MNQFRVCAAVALAGIVAAAPVAAQGRSGAVHGAPATTTGSSGTHGRPTTSPGSATTHGHSGSDHGRSSNRTSSTTTSSTTTTSTTTTTPTAPTALSAKISRNPNQLARITAMLPAGMTLDQATAGFRNQGQFIAALNASKNRGVSFVDLQKAMTQDGLSLGQAVRQLQGTTETETDGDTHTTTPTTTTPTTTTPTTTTRTTSAS